MKADSNQVLPSLNFLSDNRLNVATGKVNSEPIELVRSERKMGRGGGGTVSFAKALSAVSSTS